MHFNQFNLAPFVAKTKTHNKGNHEWADLCSLNQILKKKKIKVLPWVSHFEKGLNRKAHVCIRGRDILVCLSPYTYPGILTIFPIPIVIEFIKWSWNISRCIVPITISYVDTVFIISFDWGIMIFLINLNLLWVELLYILISEKGQKKNWFT